MGKKVARLASKEVNKSRRCGKRFGERSSINHSKSFPNAETQKRKVQKRETFILKEKKRH